MRWKSARHKKCTVEPLLVGFCQVVWHRLLPLPVTWHNKKIDVRPFHIRYPLQKLAVYCVTSPFPSTEARPKSQKYDSFAYLNQFFVFRQCPSLDSRPSHLLFQHFVESVINLFHSQHTLAFPFSMSFKKLAARLFQVGLYLVEFVCSLSFVATALPFPGNRECPTCAFSQAVDATRR